ncbi:mechanosensitive ion channel family protein [Roseateles sp.]|uniref:mechanosensitive ion channel family protein n=1 Tax=Roseateles sp. TaxID=1971397 RepID=UPI003918E2EA
MLLLLVSLLAGLGSAWAVGAVAKPAEPATLRLLNRDIVTFRVEVAGASPQRRVDIALERIRELPPSAMDLPLQAMPFEFQKTTGMQFMLGDTNLFSVVEGDLDGARGETLEGLSQRTLGRLEQARKAWHAANDRPLLLTGLLKAVAATAGFAALVMLALGFYRRSLQRLEALRDRMAARQVGVDWRELLARLAIGTTQIILWLVLLLFAYVWARLALASFVATQPLAHELDDWLLDKLAWVGEGVLEGLPGLATVLIVLLLTRAVADVLGYFFNAVQQGRLQLPFLHQETTTATRRIVTIMVWGLGIAIAYPYLPGSSSEAFKGLSVLFGLMLTLGSSGVVNQAMSGLVLVYSRALRKGDFIEVNGMQGVVTEVSSLAIKMISIRNEEITIPNAVLVANPIHNYSKLSHTHGTLLTAKVTIGYDVPWRQVHAMLEEAARRTPRVLKTPEPYVYQRALSDFYVEYELFAGIDGAMQRVPIQSALHANIQDVFNEHGVQIMSPHFLGQPSQAIVVPKSDWYKAPAHAPNTR